MAGPITITVKVSELEPIKSALIAAVEQLDRNRQQFQSYAILHRLKGTDERNAKAEVNEWMANATQAAIEKILNIGNES